MKIKQQLFAYLICVIVFFSLGMDFDTRNYMFAEGDRNNSRIMNLSMQTKNANDIRIMLPEGRLFSESRERIHSLNKQQENRLITQKELHTDEMNATEENAAGDEEIISIYEVTSHYLNVRADNNARSKILNVVKNGDTLEVQQKANNDWLMLSSGGYVNSKYTKLINKGNNHMKKPPKVTILSDDHVIAQDNIIKVSQAKPSQPSKPTSTVKSDSRLTEEHIAQIFEGTLLADQELEKTILEIEEEYGINAYFTIAVMKLESGHGKSKIARDKNNLFGLNAIDGDAYNKAYSFETKGDSVEKFGQLISDNYIDKGYTSIEKVASKYCKANPKWPSLVMNIMKKDYNKLM